MLQYSYTYAILCYGHASFVEVPRGVPPSARHPAPSPAAVIYDKTPKNVYKTDGKVVVKIVGCRAYGPRAAVWAIHPMP